MKQATLFKDGSGDGLTNVFDDTTERRMRDTKDGMAHWTRTGPEGARCRDCHFFDCKPEERTSYANPIAPCRKLKIITKRKGKPFGGNVASCRYFEAIP